MIRTKTKNNHKMKTGKKLKICGSITKYESLALLKNEILPGTVVCEADQPYSNYYGRVPDKPEPNSLFLFTERFYTLEEALRFTQNIDICAKNRVNTASAMLETAGHLLPAIRIRNFPDYQHIAMLQECFMKLGMQFARKVHPGTKALVTVNKCFCLSYGGDGIYLDRQEPREGYITIPMRPGHENFIELITKVWNNSNCKLFDAARGGLIIDGHVHEMIRIYSEHLNMELLQCIKKELDRWL